MSLKPEDISRFDSDHFQEHLEILGLEFKWASSESLIAEKITPYQARLISEEENTNNRNTRSLENQNALETTNLQSDFGEYIYRDFLLQLISEDDVKMASYIALNNAHLIDNNFECSLIGLLARLHRIALCKTRATISSESYQRFSDQIRDSLIELVYRFPEDIKLEKNRLSSFEKHKQMLIQGDIAGLFDSLANIKLQQKLEQEIISLKGRYSQLKNESINGSLTEEMHDVRMNKIIIRLAELSISGKFSQKNEHYQSPTT